MGLYKGRALFYIFLVHLRQNTLNPANEVEELAPLVSKYQAEPNTPSEAKTATIAQASVPT